MSLLIAEPDYPDWSPILKLIQSSFAYMEARLGHPSPAAKLTVARLSADAALGPVFIEIDGNAPVACLFCRPSLDIPNAMFLGRLAVAEHKRGTGLARKLVDEAASDAKKRGHGTLTLDTGASLVELHRTFRKLGFETIIGREAKTADIVTMVREL